MDGEKGKNKKTLLSWAAEAHTFNSSMWEAKAGNSGKGRVQGQSGLRSETLEVRRTQTDVRQTQETTGASSDYYSQDGENKTMSKTKFK